MKKCVVLTWRELSFLCFCGRSDAVRYLEDPRQNELFDVFADILAPVAYRRLNSDWQHVFRQAILKLMPAGKLHAVPSACVTAYFSSVTILSELGTGILASSRSGDESRDALRGNRIASATSLRSTFPATCESCAVAMLRKTWLSRTRRWPLRSVRGD